MTNDAVVGAHVRLLREARGMSQAAIAEAMASRGFEGFYPQTVLKIEKGTRSLKFVEGVVLADVLGVGPAELFELPERTEADAMVDRQVRMLRDEFASLEEGLRDFENARRYLEWLLEQQEPSESNAARARRALEAYTFEEVLQVAHRKQQHYLETLAQHYDYDTHEDLVADMRRRRGDLEMLAHAEREMAGSDDQPEEVRADGVDR